MAKSAKNNHHNVVLIPSFLLSASSSSLLCEFFPHFYGKCFLVHPIYPFSRCTGPTSKGHPFKRFLDAPSHLYKFVRPSVRR